MGTFSPLMLGLKIWVFSTSKSTEPPNSMPSEIRTGPLCSALRSSSVFSWEALVLR